MFATSTALLAETFTGRARATAFGIYGAVLGGAVAIGPLAGGAITTGLGLALDLPRSTCPSASPASPSPW